MSSSDDDDRLIARVLEHRDGRAFGALYDRHTGYLYRMALRLTAGDAATAEDVVHDAWVRAAERLGSFAHRSQLRTWLAGIVVNAWRATVRSRVEHQPLSETLAAGDQEIGSAYDRVDLERALAGLAPGYREVLILHDVEGFTHEEIGQMLGVQPGTSKSQLSRARAAMRALLEGTSPMRER